MEAIREYLNNLFMGLPETPEVLRAKAELLEMMEDKFDELVSEGKTEKEAIGIVVSEFGNLEELAQELGIDRYMKKMSGDAENGTEDDSKNEATGGVAASEKKRAVYCWNFDEARDYISYAWRHGAYIAVAVMLCIWSPFMDSVISSLSDAGYVTTMLSNIMGTSALFLFVAIAVALFCMAAEMKKEYGKLSRYCVLLDEKAGRYVGQKQQKDAQTRLTMRVVGIACCILCVVPSSVNYFTNPFLKEIMDSSVLLISGVGVLLLVLSASVGNRYTELEKAVKNAGKMEGTTFQGAEWHSSPKKGMSAATILILVFVGFLVIGGNLIGGILYMRTGDGSPAQVNDVYEYEWDDVQQVLVDLDFTDLKIVRDEALNDTGKVKVEYDGESRFGPEVTLQGKDFLIQEKRKANHWISFDIGWLTRRRERKSTTTVILPNRSDTEDCEIDIEVDAGNVTCSGLRVSELNIDLDAGNALVEKCMVGTAAFDVDAGNVEISGSQFGQMRGEVDAGNVTCLLTGSPLDYSMNLNVDLGSIMINGKKRGSSYSQESATSDDPMSHLIEMDVDLGNIEINTPTQ